MRNLKDQIMKYILAAYRFLFGWKTSDLIEHILKSGLYDPKSNDSRKKFMCISIQCFLTEIIPFRSNKHTQKIMNRLNGSHTVSGYLSNLYNLDVYPTEEMFYQFWAEYIQELRAKGE